MNEEMIKRMNEFKGKDITIFLKNGFHYFGRLLSNDEKWVEILDYKTNSFRLFSFDDISNFEIKNDGVSK